MSSLPRKGKKSEKSKSDISKAVFVCAARALESGHAWIKSAHGENDPGAYDDAPPSARDPVAHSQAGIEAELIVAGFVEKPPAKERPDVLYGTVCRAVADRFLNGNLAFLLQHEHTYDEADPFHYLKNLAKAIADLLRGKHTGVWKDKHKKYEEETRQRPKVFIAQLKRPKENGISGDLEPPPWKTPKNILFMADAILASLPLSRFHGGRFPRAYLPGRKIKGAFNA
jgi:hypothetical protein